MNSLKTFVLLAITLCFVTGCGHKKEQAMPTLPPEQVLTGNAILAPQAITLESHNVAQPVNAVTTTTVAPEEQSPLELTSQAMTEGKPTNKDIQQALKNAGVYAGSVDGNIGPKTKKAIRDFQTKNGLSADGKVGARTWKKLSAYLQQAATSASESTGISN